MELAITDKAYANKPEEPNPTNLDDFLATAVKRFARAEEAEGQNRLRALEDLMFKAGDQWPDDIKSMRTVDKRPCLTINKMKTFVHQITNDQRQNRPSINVSPVGDRSDKETAQMLKGLIRQIERQSNADVAYDTAFDSAVSIGWGYWRVLTDYESENSFDQVIRIDRIRNPFRVYIDPDHQQPDGSDAKWCFITDLVLRAEFEAQFPDANPMPWTEGTIGDEWEKWNTQTHVRIAEYFCYEPKTRKLLALMDGRIGFKDELGDVPKELIVKERDVEVQELCWYKITANEILDKREWLGKWIPIVKVIGDESDVEGKVMYAGIVRDAKDPQRMYNFWCTSETELIALAPKAPWVMEEGQVEGHEQRWKEANQKALPYLLYKGTNIAGKQAPPPERQQFVGPPAGVVQAKIGAAQDMQAVTGIRFDATINERMHDESGKALRELKRVGDIANFHYIDNLSRALKHTGRILIDLIPKIYDTKRVLTILREDDSEQNVTLDPQMQQAAMKQKDAQGNVQRLYNPKVGNYEVAVTVGPSFATKRQEAAESMINFLKVLPDSAPLIGDLIAKNMDWPGSEDISERLAAMLPPQLQQKNIEDLPSEARGIVNSLQQQLQQLKQERDQAVSMLGDKDKDRQIEMEKINKDYDAKLHGIAASMQETIIQTLGKMQEGNEAQFQKIAADTETKVQEMLMDASMQREEREMKRQDMMEEREQKRRDAQEEREFKRQQAEEDRRLKKEDADSRAKQAEKDSVAKQKAEEFKTVSSQPRKKKTKITGPSGKTYELESTIEGNKETKVVTGPKGKKYKMVTTKE